MGLAAAALHWSPDAFWRSGPCELYEAFEAFAEINGGDRKSRRDYAEFYEKMKKAGKV